MSTLAVVRANIADQLDRTDLNSQIDNAINRAIEFYYNSEGFWFDQTTGTFSTIIGQESYGTADGLPSDIIEIDYVSLTISSTNIIELKSNSYQEIQRKNAGRARGTPSERAWYQNKMYLYLIPNAVQTVTISYEKSYAALVVDADTNNYTVYARDLIENRARWSVADTIIKDDVLAAKAKAAELEALLALQARSAGITGSSAVRPTQF